MHYNLEIRRHSQIETSDDPYQIISKIINPNDVYTIIDGGASIGNTSQKLSELFPQAIVHAFEPFPEFIKVLRDKERENSRIKVYPIGLGMSDCKVKLHINKSLGTNSILATGNKSNKIYGDLLQTQETKQITLTSLDEWFKCNCYSSIDILKLDLQGSEINALKGAKKLLEKNEIKIILCEIMFVEIYQDQAKWTELIAMLEKYNLKLFNLYQCHYHHGKLLQADALFFHSSIIEIVEENSKDHLMPHSKYLF